MPKSQIKLSHSHPCHDICDELKGRYPKSFKWVGWHPNDLCYVVPIIKSEEKWWEDEDNQGTDNDEITDVPQGFKTWVANNQDRIARAEQRGTLPYFVRDNRERVRQAVKQSNVLRSGDYILNSDGNTSSGSGDTVGKFLDKSITKKEAISRLQALARDYDHEEAYIYLPDGRVYHKVGILNKVPLSEDELKSFEGGMFIHNHPKTTFSPNDIYTAIKYKFKEIRVITPTHQYKAITSDFNLRKSSLQQVKQMYNDALSIVFNKLIASNSKVADKIRANMQLYEIKEFLKILGIRYIVNSL